MQLIVLPLTLKDHPQTIATFWSQVDHPFAAADHIMVVLDYPHNSRPRPANAAALLKQKLAETSGANYPLLFHRGAGKRPWKVHE